MAAIPAEVTVDWLPASLVGLAGIAWCSIVLLRARRPETSPQGPASPLAAASFDRLIPLDALRGTIMALMAIDHASIFVRRWHPFEVWDQPLPDYPSLAAMLTRLATLPARRDSFS